MKNILVKSESFVLNTLRLPNTCSSLSWMGTVVSTKSSNFMAIANLINSLIGGGIIVLPYCMTLSGLPTGLIFIGITALITHLTLMLLIHSAQKTETYDATYADLANISFGKFGRLFLSICQFLFPFLCCISYGIAVIQNIQIVAIYYLPESLLFTSRYFIYSIPTLFLVFPLSTFKHIAFLDKFSCLSIVFVLFYTIVLFIKSFEYSKKAVVTPNIYEFNRPGMAQSFSILSFAFCCQQNMLPIYNSLYSKTENKTKYISAVSLTFVFFLYVLFSIIGFFTFSGQVYDNIFAQYCSSDHLINLTRIIFVITILLTYPIQMFAVREVIIEVISSIGYPISRICRIIISFTLVTLTYLLSVNFTKLSTAIEITGSLTAAPIAFIIPPLIYLKLHNSLTSWKTINFLTFFKCWSIIFFGFGVMVLGLYFSISSITNSFQNTSLITGCTSNN